MEKITWHSLENVKLIVEKMDAFNEEFVEDIPYLRDNPENLGSVFKQILDACSASLLAERPKPEIVTNLRRALSVGLRNFKSARNPGKVFTIDLVNQEIEIQDVETTAYVDCFQ